MGGSCIYLREWFIFMINVGKYTMHSVFGLEWTYWTPEPLLVGLVWNTSICDLLLCFTSRNASTPQKVKCSEGIMNPCLFIRACCLACYWNRLFSNRKVIPWSTKAMFIFHAKNPNLIFFQNLPSLFWVIFFEMQAIYIWIGSDLPSPHNVSSQLPNVTGT